MSRSRPWRRRHRAPGRPRPPTSGSHRCHFTDEESYGFPVEIHLTGFVLRIEWVDEDGSVRRIEAFPQGKATFTNLDTGSFTLVGTGNWGFTSHPETGEAGQFQVSGHWVSFP